jgi:hypothetical protein
MTIVLLGLVDSQCRVRKGEAAVETTSPASREWNGVAFDPSFEDPRRTQLLSADDSE